MVHFLGQQGWLANVRGRGGGLGLALPPEQIVVGKAVRATEGLAMPAECFGDEPERCAVERICRPRGVSKQAVDASHAALDGYTLADPVHNRTSPAKVLFAPAVANRA